MSLIHDALRKAAEENDPRHGGRGRPASWRDVGPVPPRPPRAVWPWVTAGGAMVVGLALLVWLAAWPQGPAVAVPSPPVLAAAPASVVPVAPAAPAPPEAVPAPAVTPAVEKVSLAPVEALAPEKAPVASPPAVRTPPAPAAEQPPAAVPAATVAASPPAPKMIAPPAQTGQVADDTYVLEAQVDGKQLRLDFIVWSAAPFAQINGRQVGVGQQVEGFLVTAIARDRVTLETPTRRLLLKVR